MTDTTELAQREKFEAWAEHACAAPWGYLKKRRTTEGYSEQIYTCMWTAWKVAGAELVEALEKEQRHANLTEAERQAYLGLISKRDERIAELESCTVTVKLPESIVDKVCLTAAEIHAQGSGVNDDKAQEIIDRIREILTPAAGIKVEAE